MALRSWVYRDGYTPVGWLVFAITIIHGWRGWVQSHEAMYLLGSQRVADPAFLAGDLVWRTLSPATFIYDHLLAPFRGVLDDLTIVGLGRVLTTIALAWSITMLARAIKLPPWTVIVGFALWVLWGQTLLICGDPLEGFQPKALAWPFVFFALAYTVRGDALRAGVMSGLAVALHVIIGGWAGLAVLATLVVNRKLFSWRQVAVFLLLAGVIAAPVVFATVWHHGGGKPAAEQALMDEIYVTQGAPHCVDPTWFMTGSRAARTVAVFIAAALVVLQWSDRRVSRVIGSYLLTVMALFLAGLAASAVEAYGFLKLHPFRLGSSLPPLFLFVFFLATAARGWPQQRRARVGWLIGLLACCWTLDDRDVLESDIVEVPRDFVRALPRHEPGRYEDWVELSAVEAYDWIRRSTPPDSCFITPFVPEFWTYAERAKVAGLRHPPIDDTLVEWNERLEAINGFQPFVIKGLRARRELERNQPRLTFEQLIRIRELYNATHYLVRGRRPDLQEFEVYSGEEFSVYDLTMIEVHR